MSTQKASFITNVACCGTLQIHGTQPWRNFRGCARPRPSVETEGHGQHGFLKRQSGGRDESTSGAERAVQLLLTSSRITGRMEGEGERGRERAPQMAEYPLRLRLEKGKGVLSWACMCRTGREVEVTKHIFDRAGCNQVVLMQAQNSCCCFE